MALQRINWTQIDTERVPSGKTVNLGSLLTPLDGVFTKKLSIGEEGNEEVLHDFFWYLSGYTPATGFTVINATERGGVNVDTEQTSVTLSTIYNTTLDPSLATPTTVGGIVAGTTVAQLTGKTFVDFLDDLLSPIVLPSYIIPTLNITGISSETVASGSVYSRSINVYGEKNDAGLFTQLRILRNSSPILIDTTLTQSSIPDVAPQFGFVDPNNPNYRYTISPTPYSESFVIPSGSSSSTYYYADGNYNAGTAKKDNKGNFDTRPSAVRSPSAPQSSDNNFATGTYTITGIFPYYYGLSDTLPTTSSIKTAIETGSEGVDYFKVLSSASGTLSIPYNNPSTWKYIWFAYQSTYTTKTKWYVNVHDNGDIDGTFISTVATQSVNSPDGYWSGISFKMHWSVYATIQNTIEFRNS